MEKKYKGAWILARNTDARRFGNADDQIGALIRDMRSDGFLFRGATQLHCSIRNVEGEREIADMKKAIEAGEVSAVYVFSLKHLSSNLNAAFEFVDKLNAAGVVVYDSEGFQYSCDWYCKKIGKRFRGGCN
jgi:hypothetical protein